MPAEPMQLGEPHGAGTKNPLVPGKQDSCCASALLVIISSYFYLTV